MQKNEQLNIDEGKAEEPDSMNGAGKPKEPGFMNAAGRLMFRLTNDYLFHVVMQRNEKVLRGLLCSLLGWPPERLSRVDLRNPILPGQVIGDKEVVLDLMLVLNDESRLNIEMQVSKVEDWPERSLFYLCKGFDNLKEGQDYSEIMPCLHIGIIDFELFKGDTEFYSRYRLENIKNGRIYTDKFGINVLNLRNIDHATDEDNAYELDVWARLFKAQTWEELRELAEKYDFAKEAATSIYAVSEEEAVKLACMARERYDHDRASFFNAGRRAEQANTEREKAEKEREKKRADDAEAKLTESEARANTAAAKLEEKDRQLQEALAEIARLWATK